MAYRVTLIPGDGTGPEIAEATRRVLEGTGVEFDWDVQLVLARDEVPGIMLGREGQLGWTTWLGTRRAATDAGDLALAPERTRPRSTTLAAA